MHVLRSLLYTLPLLAFQAAAQAPTPLVVEPKLEVDPKAPIFGGIEVADASKADISTLTLFTPESKADAWLSEAWNGVYYRNIITLEDITPKHAGFLLTNKSLSLPFYDLLVAGGGKPESLPKDADWLMMRVDMLASLGFLHSAYDLLEAVPRSQRTPDMLEKQVVYAASLNRWGMACAAAKQLKGDAYTLLHLFCDVKTKGFDNAMLRVSVMEEQGQAVPKWFTQLIEAKQYKTAMRDLPAKRDAITFAMLLSVGIDPLPKDTINDAFLDAATMPQLLQLWHMNNDEMLMHKLHARTNHFAWGHFKEGEPRSYRDERTALLDHAFKRKKADDQLRARAELGEDSPMLKALAPMLSKLSSASASKQLLDPARLLSKEYSDESDWLTVMRAYVLMDAIGYKMQPDYWVTLGEFAEGKTVDTKARYMLPNMPMLLDAMGDPAHRTDLLLAAVGALGTKEALAEQPDGLQASMLRALMAAGLEEVAFDLAAESIVSRARND